MGLHCIKPFSIFFRCAVFCAVFIACHSGQEPSSSHVLTEQDSTTDTGQAYSDATIKALLKEHLDKTRLQSIDTFQVLHSFEEEKFISLNIHQYDLSTMERFKEVQQAVSPSQQKVLKVSHYLFNKSFHPDFKSFLFYQTSDYAHHSDAIELILIPTHSNRVERLTLARFSGSENNEQTIISKWISNQVIMRTITTYEGPRNKAGEMDETSAKKVVIETYQLHPAGPPYLQLKSSIEQ